MVQAGRKEPVELKVWSGVGSPVVGGALDCKMTNGVSEGVSGAAHVEGLLFASGTDGVKPEPEDLTRRTVSPADRGVLCDKRRPLLPPPPPQGESPPALDVAPTLKDDLEQQVIKEELEHHGLKLESGERPRSNQTLVIQAPLDSGEKMSAGTGSYLSGFSASSPQSSYEHYLASSPQPYSTSTSPAVRGSPAMYTGTDNYYRDYYASSEPQYVVRQEYPSTDTAFVERYLRPPYKTNGVSSTLTVDLPSPADSGISADAITPRDQPVLAQPLSTRPWTDQLLPWNIIYDRAEISIHRGCSDPRCARGAVVSRKGGHRSPHDLALHARPMPPSPMPMCVK
ncbi:hypothetical protein Pmani_009977 [Petrolisthes manimaculis]|uniref:Uncharacterized protein n=1 Tax=Petrolisthes manimaculis TaxID=1843537 RepID=A0AAE1Q2D7_9EUCA|nr:hypothetical protein Pmani_009977 [Petrolisthes manimaculis]